MDSQFTPVTLAQSERYYKTWLATPTRSLDYTLANLWGWQEYYGLEWAFDGGLCWIRQTRPSPAWWAPLGDWHGTDWPEIFGNAGVSRCFSRVPQDLAHIWAAAMPARVFVEEQRGQWEYLYSQEELANLPGNKFHKKRNHYNGYIKSYGEPDYRDITPDLVRDVLTVQNDWCQCHECDDSPSLKAENEAIIRVLDSWDAFRNFYGGSLFIDGRMVAFSVGEKLDDENLGVHFEKGLNGYKGIYQAMNLQFTRHAGAGFKWINRAQDLDEEGLRQAKMTYMPVEFLRKFRVEIQ